MVAKKKGFHVMIQNESTYTDFKKWVLNKHGKLHTALSEEVEKAIEYYMEDQIRAEQTNKNKKIYDFDSTSASKDILNEEDRNKNQNRDTHIKHKQKPRNDYQDEDILLAEKWEALGAHRNNLVTRRKHLYELMKANGYFDDGISKVDFRNGICKYVASKQSVQDALVFFVGNDFIKFPELE